MRCEDPNKSGMNQCTHQIQSFVELETVLPNGTIANISAESNNDLFTAMKGGSNQFGK